MPTRPATRRPPPAPTPAQHGDPTPFRFGQGTTGVLLIHGWSGSPAEMRGLGQYLAAQGLVAHGVRLPGHGTQPDALHGVRWQHWAAACGQELALLRRQCDRVFVAGLSMGALLAIYLGATARPPVAGVIAMGAPIYFRDWRMRALPVLKRLLPWHTKGPSDMVDRVALTRLWHYPRLPTESIHQMSLLSREARRLLPRLEVPLLVMQGRHDRAIDPGCGDHLATHAGSAVKRLVYWDRSGHVITEDTDRDAVWAEVAAFIAAHQD